MGEGEGKEGKDANGGGRGRGRREEGREDGEDEDEDREEDGEERKQRERKNDGRGRHEEVCLGRLPQLVLPLDDTTYFLAQMHAVLLLSFRFFSLTFASSPLQLFHLLRLFCLLASSCPVSSIRCLACPSSAIPACITSTRQTPFRGQWYRLDSIMQSSIS